MNAVQSGSEDLRYARLYAALSVEVVDQAIAGDSEAFAILYNRFRGYVYAMAMNKLHNEAAAEDITQEVFLAAFVNMGKFDRNRSVAPWLATITYNLCYTYLLLKKRRKQESLVVETGDGRELDRAALLADTRPFCNPERMLEAAEQRRHILAALEALPERRRTACELHLFDDLSILEIAEQMQVTRLTVNALLVRGRQQLRKALAFLVGPAGTGPDMQPLAA